MHLLDLVSDWLSKEFPELTIGILSNEKGIGEILSIHKEVRLSFVIAYITEDEVVFGPWDYTTKLQASDPEFFEKLRLNIKNSGYDDQSWMNKRGIRTM